MKIWNKKTPSQCTRSRNANFLIEEIFCLRFSSVSERSVWAEWVKSVCLVDLSQWVMDKMMGWLFYVDLWWRWYWTHPRANNPQKGLDIMVWWRTFFGEWPTKSFDIEKCISRGVDSSLLLRHWYEIMALYYVKLILTEISALRQDRRVLQKNKIIGIKFLSIWGMLQTSWYV